MKTSIKVALLCIFLGLILLFTGVISGARTSFGGGLTEEFEEELMEIDRYIRRNGTDIKFGIIRSILGISKDMPKKLEIVGIVSKETDKFTGSYTDFDLYINGYNVDIIKTSDEQFKVEVEIVKDNSMEKVLKKTEGSELKLVLDTGMRNNRIDDAPRAFIYMPEKIENLNLHGDVARLRIVGDLFDNIISDFDVVEISLKNMQLQKLDAVFGVGDVKMNDFKCEKCDVKLDTGNISLKRAHLKNADIVINIGNYSHEKGMIADSKISVDTGEIDLETDISGEVMANVSVGDIDAAVKPDTSLDIRVDAGEIEVMGRDYFGTYVSEKTSGNSLKLYVNTGKVEIE